MAYLGLVREWNEKINLVSRKDIDRLLENHLAPSLAFAVLQRVAPGERLLDIGSGGGFPGIVNAILFSDSQFTLVDARKKKVGVLQEIVKRLDLKNVEARWLRVEKMEEDEELIGAFARTTSRAVAPLTDLVRWSTPLLPVGGTVEALKGGDLSDELKQLRSSGLVEAGAIQEHRLPAEWQLNDKLAELVIVSVTVQ